MDERDQIESGESREKTEEVENVENQALQDATLEPGTRIENTVSYAQSEQIEASLKEVLQGDPVVQAGSEVSATPITLPDQAEDSRGETPAGRPGSGVSATPINLPNPVEERTGSEQVGQAGSEVSATPINVPGPVEDEMGGTPVGRPGSEVSATPINLPNPVEERTGSEQVGQAGSEVSATPINVPGPVEDEMGGTPAGRPGSEVSATPINLPNPVEERTGSEQVGQAGSEVSATPINVPGPMEDEMGGTPAGRPGSEVSATPINLPNPVEERTGSEQVGQAGSEVSATPINVPGPVEGRMEEGLPMGEERVLSTLVDRETVLEGRSDEIEATPIPLPGPEDEAAELKPAEMEVQLPEESGQVEEGEETEEGETPNWYLHEDKDGNITVVDENGKPIDSPPVVYTYNGKKYITYPGTKSPVDENGTITDPKGLIELPYYQGETQGLYLHEDQNGKTTVVDEKGNPVDSPPIVYSYQGKNYILYPGMKSPINEKGDLVHPENLIEVSYYKAELNDLYLHEDKDGNVTVVDENGNPVKSPPIVYTYEGKNYLLYPGMKSPVNEKGELVNPQDLVEASYYQTSTDGLFLHEDKDGNITVVDESGNPVKSPPIVYTYQGKHYLTYPGSESAIKPDGSISNPELFKEAAYYKADTENMYVHEDKDGKLTVVDENGGPVKSPPIVIEYEGKHYLVYPGDQSAVDEQGKVVNPEKLVEAPSYKASMDGLYIHEDQDGKITVVDKDGKIINSPPVIFEYNGEYYAGYPGSKPPFGPDGSPTGSTDMKKLNFYKPSWWSK